MIPLVMNKKHVMIITYYKLISNYMTTLSIPLGADLEDFVNQTTAETGLAKTDVVRQALRHYQKEMAVQKVLLAASEPSLSGDLDELMQTID